MIKSLKFGLLAALIAVGVSACGEKVEVPPATVGKVLTSTGYAPETIPPSKFRLPVCWAYCDSLVVLELSDNPVTESFTLFMPKDQLTMTFDIRATAAIQNGEAHVNQILDRVASETVEGHAYHRWIDFDKVYSTYGRPVLREVTRSVIAEYSINEIASNREQVNGVIREALNTALGHTPLKLLRVGLADVTFPDVIIKAKEEAKKREIAIRQAEADKQVRMVNLQTELEVAKQRRNIKLERAKTILDENAIIAKSVTPDYLAYRRLEVLEEIAKSNNAVFVPFASLDTVGLNMRQFQNLKKSE